MSFARSSGRLLTTTRGAQVTPQLSALSTIRPGRLSMAPWSPRGDQKRCFHWPAAIEAGIQASQDSLIALNTTLGLPWYLAIPAMAMAVNLTVRLPLQAYARSIVQKQSATIPFIQAWGYRHVAMHPRPFAKKQSKRSATRIFRERRIQGWKTYASALSFPFWFLFPEALRRMTGMPGGLLAWLQDWGSSKKDLATIEPSPMGDFESSPSMLQEPSEVVETATSALHAAWPTTEQGLATGGALWFPDLTVADPYAILPIVLAGSMIYNLVPISSTHRRALFNLKPLPNVKASDVSQAPVPVWKLRLMRILIVTSAGFTFITCQLPCAMVLYWACSSLFSGMNYLILERLIPIDLNRFPVCKAQEPNFLAFQVKK